MTVAQSARAMAAREPDRITHVFDDQRYRIADFVTEAERLGWPTLEAGALNIGGFRASLREVASIVRGITQTDIRVEDGSWNGTDHHYDLNVAEAAIGYVPRIGLDEGLRENIA